MIDQPKTAPLKLFYSYAVEDEEYRKKLEKHLSVLKKQKFLVDWHFRMISGGKEWKDEIDKNLEESNIILLLISSDFLSSDYCYDVEMKKALELHAGKDSRVIPIILRPCDWEGTPFENLEAFPKDALPISNWTNQDEAFLEITKGIKKVCSEMQQSIGNMPTSVKIESLIQPKEEIPKVIKNNSPDIPTKQDKSYPEITEGYEKPTVLFDYRMSDGFPGIRGLWFTDNKKEIIARLKTIFRKPLFFECYYPYMMMYFGYGGTGDIAKFKIIDEQHILLGNNEYNVRKLAVYRPQAYWQSFIYIENSADSPTGLYKNSKLIEEYAIFKKEFITKAEYDDGCIFRQGKSISIGKAELRIRHLKPTNLIISSRNSPINRNDFDNIRCKSLKRILSGTMKLESFVKVFEKLPKHPNDYV
jgi:hypothetical protein